MTSWGFDPSEDPTTDPFASDSDADSINDSEEDESRNNSDHNIENVSVEGECDASSEESAVSCSGVVIKHKNVDSGKVLRKKTFANFVDLGPSVKVFFANIACARNPYPVYSTFLYESMKSSCSSFS